MSLFRAAAQREKRRIMKTWLEDYFDRSYVEWYDNNDTHEYYHWSMARVCFEEGYMVKETKWHA